MISIKLYGTSTSWYQFLKKFIIDLLNFNDIEFKLEEVNEVHRFITDNIKSVPCLTINDSEPIALLTQNMISFALSGLVSQLSNQIGKKLHRQILVPIDFSDNSKAALIFATQLLKHKPYIINALHVCHPFSPVNFESNEEETLEKEMKQLQDIVSVIGNDFVGNTTSSHAIIPTVKTGLAGDIINDYSEFSELIVMGSNGKSNLNTMLFGSVSRAIISHSACPIIIVPQFFKFTRLKRVLVSEENRCNVESLGHLSMERVVSYNYTSEDVHALVNGTNTNDLLKECLDSDDTMLLFNKEELVSSFSLFSDHSISKFYEYILKRGKPIMICP